jgi:tetratricopeptide (TPR) repeat protein
MLALVLASSGDYRRSEQALHLLAENASRRNDPEDERAKAIVQAMRPGERQGSIKTLEESFVRMPPTPYERFLLARLYEANRENDKATQVLQDLVNSEEAGDNTFFLSYHVFFLLRNKKVNEAESWLVRLEQKEPQTPRSVELRARVLQAGGQGDQAARLLVELAGREFSRSKEPQVLGQVGLILEQLEHPREAEPLVRRFVAEASTKQPDSILVLVDFLARQQRLDEALTLLEKSTAMCSPERVAWSGVAAVRLCPAKQADLLRVERKIVAAQEENPRSVNLLVYLGDLRDAEGRYDEAVAAYRKVLEIKPDNILALNNLAWLLAFQYNRSSEALKLLEEAIRVAGLRPDLLDTRGVILSRMDRHQEALNDLEEAIAQQPNGLRYFHLAQVYWVQNKKNEASKAWKRSSELGIKPYDIHALERDGYSRLQQEFQNQP